MPYTYKKQGDKYVVYKKDSGKRVGATKGTKEALKKYLAALHMHEIRSYIREQVAEMLRKTTAPVTEGVTVQRGSETDTNVIELKTYLERLFRGADFLLQAEDGDILVNYDNYRELPGNMLNRLKRLYKIKENTDWDAERGELVWYTFSK